MEDRQNHAKDIEKVKKAANRFGKVVVWGLKSHDRDSFRYIQNHFYTTLQKLGINSVWLDDEIDNNNLVEKGDMVWAANVTGKNLKLKKDVYYCLHNYDKDFYKELNKKNYLIVQVYSNDADKGTQKWDSVTRFDRKNQVLYEPWGTNLLPWEFKNPVFPKSSPFVFWVGSIWNNDQNQGNLEEIEKLKKVLGKHHVYFLHPRYVPDFIHWRLIRWSRIAPTVAGNWQVKVNYLPCRMFKNISYGQLGITNVKKFEDLLGSSFIKSDSIEDLVEKSLAFSEKKYISLVKDQQEIIKKQTYMQKVMNLFKGLEIVSS